MNKRALGRSGLEIAPIALGASVFGWTVDEPTAFGLMDVFIDRGFNLLDTADVYYVWAPGNKGGESETIIGNWLARRGRRDDVILATKVGEEMAAGEGGLSRGHIMRAVEASLSRLRTDYIDLYQAHVDDRATPLEETLHAFETLIARGKVRVIGASNYESPRLAEALRISAGTKAPRYECLQTLYNLCDRAPFETDLMALCQAHDVGVITYRSLARGFLSGKYRSSADRDLSVRGADAITYLNARGNRILAALDEVASSYRATPSQVALAWLMAQPGVTSAITSASRPAQLHELLAAVELALDPDALAFLSAAST
jgi:aryl-alcohol dehydrogenase-like predicted oxidoreductase